MRVDAIQLCQGPDVIAQLQDFRGEGRTWCIPLPHGNFEPIDDEKEIAQLYHCLSGDFTGYMVFRAVEYEDVQICVIF